MEHGRASAKSAVALTGFPPGKPVHSRRPKKGKLVLAKCSSALGKLLVSQDVMVLWQALGT